MLLPFDELNNLMAEVEATGRIENGKMVYDKDDCSDYFLDFLILSYVFGCDDANASLGTSIEPNSEKIRDAVYKKIADKDFAERVAEYAEGGDLARLEEVARTEMHRDYNTGAYDTATEGGAKYKTWNCLFVNSRDTHMYLHGTTVPMDEEFYTFMGNHAMFPGQFGVAEEDCNCNCWLTYKT